MKFLVGVLLLTLITVNKSYSTNLRGQIVRFDPTSQHYFPLPNVRVDFWLWNGVQWIDASYTVTGGDGFYYFLNVNPGLVFQIQVFGNRYPAQPLSVVLVNYPYFQDIPFIST